MSTVHSKIGASSMSRWSACPGSVRLCEGVENKSSVYAEEGTNAHTLAAEVLEKGWPKTPIDHDLQAAVGVYVDFVMGLMKNPQTELLVEHKFDLSKLHPGLFGTADAVVYNRLSRTLFVVDYKHGAGLPVSVLDNQQLKYYALGALMTCGFPARTIELVIVQPRCPHPDGPVRSFVMTAADLLDFATDLVTYAKATEDVNAPLRSGPHCRFCPASGFCSELHNKAVTSIADKFTAVTPYDPQKLSDTLEKLDMIQDWAKSVREFAYNEARAGRPPPGYKLVEKRATRKWIDESNAAKLLWSKFGVSDADSYEHKLKSPAQIEKFLSKNDKKDFDELCTKESSGLTLVHVSDKRPAATPEQSLLAEFTVINEQKE